MIAATFRHNQLKLETVHSTNLGSRPIEVTA